MSEQDHLTVALQKVCQVHGVDVLEDVQQLCLLHLVKEKRNVQACLPIGGIGGTSTGRLIYQAWPTMCREMPDFPDKPVVVVLYPLLSIWEEQVDKLTKLGISAAYPGQSRETDYAIQAGDVSLVFSSPQRLVRDSWWRKILKSDVFRQRLVGLAIDDVFTWGESGGSKAPFQSWYESVGKLRSFLPATVPVLALTSTAYLDTRRRMIESLGLHNCLEIVRSPDRSNIRLAVKKVSSDAVKTFSWLVSDLRKKGPNAARTVIYCQTIHDCSMLYLDVFKSMLREKSVYPPRASDVCANRVVDVFHREIEEEVQDHIMESLENPHSLLRVVIATNALCDQVGVVFRGVQHIVNYGPPKDFDDFVQASERAGRDGGVSHSLVLYHGEQLVGISETMRQYVVNEEGCRRRWLQALFGGAEVQPVQLEHACCDICARACRCQETCDGKPSGLEKQCSEDDLEW